MTNAPVANFPAWAANPTAKLVTGDFDGDHFTDLALVGGTSWQSIPIAVSEGDGRFQVINSPLDASNPTSPFASWASIPQAQVVTGDFDCKSTTDLALLGVAGWSTIPVAFSQGDGSFRVTNLAPDDPNFVAWSAAQGVRIVVGRFSNSGSGCGDEIALVGGPGWQSVPIASGTLGGPFKVTNAPIDNFAVWAANPLAQVIVADFNDDLKDDLALTGVPGWGSIPVAFSNRDGTFTVTNKAVASFPGWAANGRAKIVVGDFNLDSRADIALTGVPGWQTIPIALSDGSGGFAVTNQVVPSFPALAARPNAEVVVGDFDDDGNTDMALLGIGQGAIPVAFSKDGRFTVTLQNPIGAGDFQAWSSRADVKSFVRY